MNGEVDTKLGRSEKSIITVPATNFVRVYFDLMVGICCCDHFIARFSTEVNVRISCFDLYNF